MSSPDFVDDHDDFPLRGLRIGISGSVPEPKYWDEPALDRGIMEFVRLFSGHVLKLGGHVVHGSHPNFTPIIVRQAERFQSEHPESRPLTLIVSRLWVEGQETEFAGRYQHVAKVIFTPKLGGGDTDDPQTRKLSLTALRLALAQESDVLVAVGGKLHRESGFTPGVLQELTVARWHHLPCFVIAGLGGMAGELDGQVVARLCDENRLAADVGQELANSRDITGTVGTVIQHLVKTREQFAKPTARGLETMYLAEQPSERESRYAQFEDDAVRASADRFDDVLEAVVNSKIDRFTELLSSSS